MAITPIPYAYDKQIRRFTTQVVKAFSGFQVSYMDNGNTLFKMVPCTYATRDKQAATIRNNNSSNIVLSTPAITAYIETIEYDRANAYPASVVMGTQVIEQKIKDGEYTGERGNSYYVERLTPVPLKIKYNVDCWTTNLETKLELLEQISTSFNVGIDIQNSDNPLEWTSRSTLMLTDILFSNVSIPVGSNNDIDVLTFKFELPILLSPPAKIKKLNIIERIITNIHAATDETSYDTDEVGEDKWRYADNTTHMYTNVTTPHDATIVLEGNKIILKDYSWDDIVLDHGTIQPGVSKFALFDDIDRKGKINVIGTITPTNSPSVLLWTPDIDTLPKNTLTSLTGIINPMKQIPGRDLPIPTNGTRYLILADIGQNLAWGFTNTNGLMAEYGDIIEFNNGIWKKVFDASRETDSHIITCLSNNKQYLFKNHEWVSALDGKYHNDYWKLEI